MAILAPQRILSVATLLSLALLPVSAQAPDRPAVLIDDAGVLTEVTEAEITAAIRRLNQEAGVELFVLTVVPNGWAMEAHAQRLFRSREVGAGTRHGGSVLAISPADGAVYAELGGGLEQLLSADRLNQQLRHEFQQSLREQNVEAAVRRAVVIVTEAVLDAARLERAPGQKTLEPFIDPFEAQREEERRELPKVGGLALAAAIGSFALGLALVARRFRPLLVGAIVAGAALSTSYLLLTETGLVMVGMVTAGTLLAGIRAGMRQRPAARRNS
jgi:uncharacterized membrane protein YgcG